MTRAWEILEGNCLDVLPTFDADSVQTCITSPPYWGLRNYGCEGQLGLEPTPEEYVAKLVEMLREVRRVLRDDGTLWLNLGDSYCGAPGGWQGKNGQRASRTFTAKIDFEKKGPGLKPKDLVGIPWRVAFALQADGWYLRSDIIWSKPNPMPESVMDRPTKAHEYVFLLTRSGQYFYDSYAGSRPDSSKRLTHSGRKSRTVWTIPSQPFRGAHFSVFPIALIEPCVLAGTPPIACGVCRAPWEREIYKSGGTTGKSWHDHSSDLEKGQCGPARMPAPTNPGMNFSDYKVETLGWRPTCDHDDDTGRSVVLVPFAGSGTTGVVCRKHGRRFVGIELNADYAKMARGRLGEDLTSNASADEMPLFSGVPMSEVPDPDPAA